MRIIFPENVVLAEMISLETYHGNVTEIYLSFSFAACWSAQLCKRRACINFMIQLAQYVGTRPERKDNGLHAAGIRHKGEVHLGRTNGMHILHKEPTPYMDACKWYDLKMA